MNSQIMIYSVAVVTVTVINMYCQIWSLIDQNCIRIERCGWQRERRPGRRFWLLRVIYVHLQISSS